MSVFDRASARRGLVAALLAAMPLAACGTSEFAGLSPFGDNRLATADLSNIGGYTAERARSEARAHFRNNDFGYAVELYKRLVTLAPNDPEGYIGLGASYDRLRRFDLADRAYASLYQLTGGTAQYYNNLGYSLLLRGDLKSAQTNLMMARQIDPQNAVVNNNLQMLARVAGAKAAKPAKPPA
jgi:Flp pilus assembly protein TadD